MIDVRWLDGTPVGILGDLEQTMARCRRAAADEDARKQELRDRDVVVLEDYK